MNFNSSTQRYEFSVSAAAILQGFGKVITGDPPSPLMETSPRPMTEAEAVSLFCDLLKVCCQHNPALDLPRDWSISTLVALLIATSNQRIFSCTILDPFAFLISEVLNHLISPPIPLPLFRTPWEPLPSGHRSPSSRHPHPLN